jgi:copper oxidase (laccase) domain-containing protein
MVAAPTAPLRWYLAYGVELAFSTAADGDMRESVQRQNWLKRIGRSDGCRVPRQVHGVSIVDATDRDGLLTADGLVSRDGGDIGVYGADCPGLCIATEQVFGLAHCGWRGAAGGIVERLVTAISAATTQPRSAWHACIGPGISAAHYQVDTPVLAARSWPSAALSARTPGHAQLDLAQAIREDLRGCGIDQVVSSGVCTREDPRLHSYRHQGQGPTQLLAAWRVR